MKGIYENLEYIDKELKRLTGINLAQIMVVAHANEYFYKGRDIGDCMMVRVNNIANTFRKRGI